MTKYLEYLLSSVNFLLVKKYMKAHLFFMSFILILFYLFMYK